ncbi:MAG: gamma-glutamyltransferase [Verrucomicrobium sp.]|nr:gamma-glutamyltransferase [Verrucomicrobium sp.]
MVASAQAEERPPVSSKEAGVASVHPLATEAGLNALRQGGNAVDAAIATAITLGVVDGHNSGLGGGCFILIRSADGQITAIDARETAPALATRDMYLVPPKPGEVPAPAPTVNEKASKTGALAVATPGALAGYALALERHGKLKLRDIALPAAKLAEEGFPLDKTYARRLASTSDELKEFPASRELFFNANGEVLKEGDVLKQADLARLLKAIAEQGAAAFYRGEFSQKVGAWMQANGGVLREEDFSSYQVKLREPLRSTYRGNEIVGFPPPSSGGVHVAQILNLLENFDLAKLAPANRVHVIAESMKLAFADRAYWLGDPAFTKLPSGLIDKSYARTLAERIDASDAGKALTVTGHGQPPRADTDFFGDLIKHTTHLSAADKDGNWVAITQTINTSFGSKVIVPGTGVLLNNEMDDFAVAPNVPNAFKLVGSEANAVAPGKRPLSSMSPTLVLGKDGRPFLSVGAAGGPTIITQTVQNIVGVIDLNLTLEAALAAPRIHHQWSPDELRMEYAFSPEVLEAMKQRGHAVQQAGPLGIGTSQGVRWDAVRGEFEAVREPRGR